MLAEFGRGAMRLRRDVAELDGAVYDSAPLNVGMIDGGKRADRFGLRIVEHFGIGTHGRPHKIVVIENWRPFVGGPGGDGTIYFAGECGAVLCACSSP